MNELDRKIKDIEVLVYNQLFTKALIDILEIAQTDSILINEERAKMVKARFLRVSEDLAHIPKFWKCMSDEKDEKIEKLKELVIKQTNTAARLDPLHKGKYWRRLNNAGFYEDNLDRIIDKYVREIDRLFVQHNTAD